MASNSIFSGSSQFSSDFQALITRTVAIASLPLQQRQADVKTLQSQSVELSALGTAFAGLQSALTGLNSALGASSYGSTVSDAEVAGVALTGTPLPGTFSIEVLDLGIYASSMSIDGLTAVGDPSVSNLTDATSFTLEVGGKTHIITPTGNSLLALAEAINFSSDTFVQATLVNVGSPSAPDYRLSLQGINLGDSPIELRANDGSNPGQILTANQTTGSNAQYRVNGQPAVAISSETRVVTISPGVIATLHDEGTTNVTVSRSTTAASSALARFATAYNAAQAAIDSNRGEGAGALRGDGILITLSNGLHRIAEYASGQNKLNSLTALGLSFDQDGVLSFDSAAFAAATNGKIPQLVTFLGSSTSGGFLKAAADLLSTVSGEEGALANVTASVRAQIEAANESIAAEEKRIDILRTSVEARMAAADAAIAALEQQYKFISGVFTAMSEANRNR